MGPLVAQPLTVLLATMLVGILLYWRSAPRLARGPLTIVTVSWVLLVILGVPVTGRLLRRSLSVPATTRWMPPEFIVVLSGGYDAGRTPDQDILSSASILRGLAGAHLWKQYPTAKIIITGRLSRPDRDDRRLSELIRDLIVSTGVPRDAIELETTAATTREHPTALLAFKLVKPTTRIAIVTSDVHMRRSLVEFARHFSKIDAQPVVDPESHLDWSDFVPQLNGFYDSTIAFHELIGMVWYEVRTAVPDPQKST